MKKILFIDELDNVGVAVQEIHENEIIDEILVKESIDVAHKISLKDIKKGESVIKYGLSIGYASQDIPKGSWVHTHNCNTNLKGVDEYHITLKDQTTFENSENKVTIPMFRRASGNFGIRNELLIIPTVGCISITVQRVADQLKKNPNANFASDIVALTHPFGCSQLGDDHLLTQKTLQAIARHPNAGGVIVIGLGCENNQLAEFISGFTEAEKERMRWFNAQDVEDEMETALSYGDELLTLMSLDKREDVSIRHLAVGLKCGGSDGFSGITANPLVGKFSDWLISQGGTTMLTEVPEMFGAETLLMERACSEVVLEKTIKMIQEFKQYYLFHDQNVYENPSPGNKKGGITTLEDKSLGCTQKAGKAPVVDVLNIGESYTKKGLNLLNGPGNDLIATTALGAAGCHMVLFTTGRGTPFGGFIPTLKISSNSTLFEKKPHWIDLDAGKVINHGSFDESLEELKNLVIRVAQGDLCKAEENGYKEIAVFKKGVVL